MMFLQAKTFAKKYGCFLALLFLVGCSSTGTKPDGSDQNNSGLKINYDAKKDTISLDVKKRPFIEVVKAFQKVIHYDLFYNPADLQKEVTFSIPSMPPLEALKTMVKKGEFVMARSKVGVGFAIRSPWTVPTFNQKELGQKIEVATQLDQVGNFLDLNNRSLFKPLTGAKKEREITADIYYVYRAIFQKMLWEKIPILKEKQYHIPYKLEKLDRIRTFYDPKASEVLCETLFLVSLTHKIHIVFQYTFYSLNLKKITLFVTALGGADLQKKP